MSGECLCGAFARPDELVEIRYHFPEVAQRIDELQVRAVAQQPDLFSLCWSCGNEEQSRE
jgi:hypothetical protein